MLQPMSLGLDREEIGLIAVISAIFVLRALVPGLTRRAFPPSGPKRGWREWSMTEKAGVGFCMVLLVAVWLYRPGSLASVVAAIGIVMVTISIKGLLALWTRGRAGRASRPTRS
jgi:hypothetical protein